MAARRDMRREHLIVPYTEPEAKDSSGFQSTMSSTLPWAAIFTRNRLLGWTSVLFAVQSWLAETPASAAAAASSPAYLQVAMAFLSLGLGYMPLFLPPTSGGGGGLPAAAARAP